MVCFVPLSYSQNWWQRFRNWIKSLFSDDYNEVNPPELAAEKVIFPFATKAYRRFLKDNEKTKAESACSRRSTTKKIR
jgi:hypothetical protein